MKITEIELRKYPSNIDILLLGEEEQEIIPIDTILFDLYNQKELYKYVKEEIFKYCKNTIFKKGLKTQLKEELCFYKRILKK